MSLLIYGTSRSRAFRVLWAAKELGLAFEHRPISWQHCRSDKDYLALNAAGTIPCVVDDGLVLSESLAINLHLAQGSQGFWPRQRQSQSKVIQWSFWAQSSLEGAYMRWATHTYWLPERLRSADEAGAALEELRRPLDRLEHALSGEDWLVDGLFTIADLNTASVIPLLRHHEGLSEWPKTKGWLDRCTSRQSFVAASSLP